MKQTKGFGLISIIIIIIVTSIVASIATGVIMINGNKNNYSSVVKDEALQEFIDVYETLVSKYYDDVDKEGMLNAAEEGMVDYLGDRYTTYLEDDEYSNIIDELAATYDGIGVSIVNNQIYSITPSSPASKAGLMVGDLILKVNGSDVQNKSSEEIANLIKKDTNKTISLEVNRDGNILNFNLEKETLVNTTISYEMLEDNIGYLAITKFSEGLSSQVSEALKDLESKNMTSLIIDVRDDVGGYLASAEDVASLFLEEGKTIYTLESNSMHYTYKDKTKEKRDYEIVVLINNNSASASEILAAALKESYNATLIGTKSFGKGKVQQVAELGNGDSVKYTSAKWLTPNGTCIDGVGLTPDINVEITDINVDVQLNKAIEVLKG